MIFFDRTNAGQQLAERLLYMKGPGVVVLGLPRGGVLVAYEVALALNAGLDVIVVRKLGLPSEPDLAMGAIGEGGVRVVNEEVIYATGMSDGELAAVESRERQELERRVARLRRDRAQAQLQGRVVLVVDDGIATGSTARAACQVARARGPSRLVLAVPVAPMGWQARARPDVDEFVCLASPDPFFAVGQFYADFSQTSDDEVVDCLERAAERAG